MKKLAFLIALFAFPALIVGCGADENADDDHGSEAGHADHDGHDDHDDGDSDSHAHDPSFPKSFVEAVEKVAELSTTVKDAYEREDVGVADKSIHDIGHIMGHMGEWIDESSLSDEDKKAAKDASDKLFSIYEKLHGANHGKDAKYGEVSIEVEETIALLKSKAEAAKK